MKHPLNRGHDPNLPVYQQFAPDLTILSFVLSVIYYILPMDKVNEKYFKVDDPEPNEDDYNTAKIGFETDYKRSNLAYSDIARE